MTALHLIHVPIRTNALARWAGERGWVRRRRGIATFDEGRALHHLLDETVGPSTLRPFRLLVPPRREGGNLYAYSALDADALRTTAHIQALPDHLGVLRPDRMESKPMPDDWRVGQRLGFDLRIRPVRRLRIDIETATGWIGKGKEIDAFLLEALRQHPADCSGMTDSNRTREAVYLDWLAERLAPAASLDRSASGLVRFQRAFVVRGSQGLEGPDATFHGTLTVVDTDAFTDLLSRGVGRHRAYGYGMLLLRSPNKQVAEG